jgi:bla regulator protein blaR1
MARRGTIVAQTKDPGDPSKLTFRSRAMTFRLAAPALGVFAAPLLMNAAIGVLSAQTVGSTQATSSIDTASSVAFEVASIKANKSGDGRVMLAMPPTGRFTATNVPLRLLVQNSYGLQPFQIVGGPAWLTSDRFDIVAKAPDGFTPDQLRPMVRNLLGDRFKLKAHVETREMPTYALMLARADGKLGPKLTTAKADCDARGRRGGGPPPAPPAPGEPIECGFIIGIGTMNAGSMGMADLARSLSGFVNRIVADKTGLSGKYDFQLTYTPEGRGLPGLPVAAPLGADAPPADPNGASLFTALQEQLGLKLDSQKGMVDVLVIDSVEQPTED